MKSRYDAIILGAGHNGLVAAAYLAKAGLSVLVSEKNNYLGGATTSQRVFPDYDANLSRYAYLVALFSSKIVTDLGLQVEFRRRSVAAFTPYLKDDQHRGLLMSNVSESVTRDSLRELTGSDAEFERLQKFYSLVRLFADRVWDTMLEPLRTRAQIRALFTGDTRLEESWRCLIEEPLGVAIERYLTNDLLRGVVFTDAKIGLLTHPHDDTLLQNRCFIYHLIGNKTGEWKVPVGGMGHVAEELERVARLHGAEIVTNARVEKLDLENRPKTVQFQHGGKVETAEAKFLLVNFGKNILAQMIGRNYAPDATHEGSVFKINMLCRKLPSLKVRRYSAVDGFTGTFNVDEGYEAMQFSHRQATLSKLPEKIPCELYCHTLTDASILAPDLQRQGYHALTLFGLDTPWRLFAQDDQSMKERVQKQCLKGLNAWLTEPIENCLATNGDGSLCLENKSPVDIETELGHYRGNIFHGALTWPFAEDDSEAGTWGVETEWPNVFICGSSARRGGAVSGIPGHNAAMKVLEAVRTS